MQNIRTATHLLIIIVTNSEIIFKHFPSRLIRLFCVTIGRLIYIYRFSALYYVRIMHVRI